MGELRRVKEIFDKIAGVSGKKSKETIIKQNKDNELFLFCLKFLLDSNITTGLSKKKINKKVQIYQNTYSDIRDMFRYLSLHNSGTDINIGVVQGYINSLDEDLQDFVRGLLTKSLKIGADTKTVNKALGYEFIPQFNIMLGSKVDLNKLPKGDKFVTEKYDGCFVGYTNILMSDGTNKKIKDVKVGDEVLSFNEYTKEISNKKVINVFRNGYKPKEEWLRIKYYTDLGRGGYRSLNVTRNHKIFTDKGWMKADDIKVNDYIYIYEYIPSQEEISVLLGLGIGDGAVIKDDMNTFPTRFRVDYVDNDSENERLNKYKILFKNNYGSETNRISGYGSKMRGFTIKTYRNLPGFMTNKNNIRGVSYKLNEEILDNIDWLTLATFYMDDGHKTQSKDDGDDVSNVRPRAVFTLARQDDEEVLMFAEFLKYKLNTDDINVCCEKKLKDDISWSYSVSLGVKATEILFDNITKYIPKCLRYKIGKKWEDVEEYDWWNKFGKFGLVKVKVGEIDQSFLRDNKKRTMSYDLEIEGNHTYFANKVAVHNCRCFTQIRNGKIIMKSRQNKIFEGLIDIENSIKELGLNNICIDGELLAIDSNYENVYKDTMKIVSTKEKEKHGVKYMIFDILPIDEFDNKKGVFKYSERRKILDNIKQNEFISITPVLYHGTDNDKVLEVLSICRANGAEGCMINLDKSYEFKRSKTLLKLKVMNSCDLKIIGFEEGDGKYKGVLGNLICDYKGCQLGVGSGFSDKQREQIWNNQEEYLNRIAEIQYFEETYNDKGGLSLRFPVFKCVRELGKEVSYN